MNQKIVFTTADTLAEFMAAFLEKSTRTFVVTERSDGRFELEFTGGY